MSGIKISNEYARKLGALYDRTPKAVFAAIAVSMLTSGGDRIDEARSELLREWSILHENGIVPQRPPSTNNGAEALAILAGRKQSQAPDA